MNGVEILNEIPVYDFSEWVLGVSAFVLIVTPLAFLIVSIIQREDLVFIFMKTVIGLLVGFFITILFVTFTSETDIIYDKNSVRYYQYEVIISDEVKFNEFTEKYEIIEQNGSIYTVQERN